MGGEAVVADGSIVAAGSGDVVREMTIADYEDVRALWLASDGVVLREEDDSREAIRRYLAHNPGLSFVAERAAHLRRRHERPRRHVEGRLGGEIARFVRGGRVEDFDRRGNGEHGGARDPSGHSCATGDILYSSDRRHPLRCSGSRIHPLFVFK
jgi:hypothetical protein